MQSRARYWIQLSIVTTWCAFSCKDEDKPDPGVTVGREAGESGAGGDGGAAGQSSEPLGGGGAGLGGDGGTAGAPAPEVAFCTLPWSAPLEPSGCDLENLEPGETLSDYVETNLTLESGKVHTLEGSVRVRGGVTLSIEPCTKIVGLPESALAVLPGAKIKAVGEPGAPIVFTSSKPKGERAAGDWGGLLILGRAQINDDGASAPGIGVSFGTATADHNEESSGTLAYVRIEFAGRVLRPESASAHPSLMLGGVGSGTSIHHVQVLHSGGDCFQWRGGTVDAHHLVGIGCSDDIFDAKEGFAGRVQFVFGRQVPYVLKDGKLTGTLQDLQPPAAPPKEGPDNSYAGMFGSNGLELHSQYPNPTRVLGSSVASPVTTGSWSNVTVCGQRDYEIFPSWYGPIDTRPEPPNPRVGLFLGGNAGGRVVNALVTGFLEGFRLQHDNPDFGDPVTVEHAVFGKVHFFTHPALDPAWLLGGMGGSGGSDGADQHGNSVLGLDGVCDCWSSRPSPFPPTRMDGGPSIGIESEATFIGAFEDARPESNWMAEPWVDFAEN